MLAIHLRPASQRDRDTIINPFGKDRFVSVFESLLPFDVSPLDEEARFLKGFSSKSSIARCDYYDRRLEYLMTKHIPGDYPIGPLWGIAPGINDRLRPGSIYGEGLSALATLVAVGSAVHRKRYFHSALGGRPEWRQFEIPAIVRSYYDPLIVCSVLRWLRAEECWWGREASQSKQVINEMIRGYDAVEDQVLVVAELLLASAMGKVPSEAKSNVSAETQRLLVDRRVKFGKKELTIGLAILDWEREKVTPK